MPSEVVKAGIDLVATVVTVDKGNADARAAGNALAKSVRTVAETINTFLLPLAAINYASMKAKSYFEKEFPSDMARVTEGVPPEKLIEPSASIAGPALQGLAYSHQEPDLKKLFLALLGSAMNADTASSVHPAYVTLISQLNAEEANLLVAILKIEDVVPAAQVRLNDRSGGLYIIKNHILGIVDEKGKPAIYPQLSIWVDNWIRLGLVEVNYDVPSTWGSGPTWTRNHPVVEEAVNTPMHSFSRPHLVHGVLQQTALGSSFAEAVGLFSA